MRVEERMETINKAAMIVRDATGHDEFTLDDLRRHIDSDQCKVTVENGKAYVPMSYIGKLIYNLGRMRY